MLLAPVTGFDRTGISRTFDNRQTSSPPLAALLRKHEAAPGSWYGYSVPNLLHLDTSTVLAWCVLYTKSSFLGARRSALLLVRPEDQIGHISPCEHEYVKT